MSFPDDGFIKIFPATTQIISGEWAFNNDAHPQPSRAVALLDAYYAARAGVLATAPDARRNFESPAASGIYIPTVGAYELQFSASTLDMEFYGSPFIPANLEATANLNSGIFPMGMTISSLRIGFNARCFFGPSRNVVINNLVFKWFGTTLYTYTPVPFPSLLNGIIYSPTSGSSAIIPSALTSVTITQALKTFGVQCTVNATASGLLNQPEFVLIEPYLLGTYNTLLFRSTPTQDGENINPGATSTLINAAGYMGYFDPDEFRIFWDAQDGDEESTEFPGFTGGVYIPRRNIIQFDDNTLEYVIPDNLGIPYGGRRLMLVGSLSNFLFSGQMPLQNYNITLVDGSGLYNLTPGKRNDTYYDRSVTPSVTVDLKIPDPRVKTGFFNG